MAFLNGSTATINGVAGSGVAVDTADFLARVRSFLSANGWTVVDVVAIGGGNADVIFSSDGENSDENIVVRMQDGTVAGTLAPLNTNVDVDRVRFTAAPFFDSAGQLVYNEAGESKVETEINVDDDANFNFWVFTDADSTHVTIVTQVGGVYRSLTVGRLQRQVFTELAKSIGAVTVSVQGTPEVKDIALDRPRPASWVQGKKLFVHSLNVNDATGTQIIPVELATVQDQTGVPASSVKIEISRDYGIGAIIGQDPLPIGVIKNAVGGGENLAMSHDNGGAVNILAYVSPSSQIAQVAVAELFGFDISAVLAAQNPDDYQGDQLIVGLFSHDDTANRTFSLRHQLANYGRIPAVNNPLDELELPNGDKWLTFTVGTDRVAVGKVN